MPVLTGSGQTFHDNSLSQADFVFSFNADGAGEHIGAFAFTVGPHTNMNSANGISVTIGFFDALGNRNTATTSGLGRSDNEFFGFTFDSEVYLESVRIVIGGTNSGIRITGMQLFNGDDALGSFFGDGGEWDEEIAATPEPGTLAMIGLGLAGLGYARRRQMRRATAA